MARNYRELVVWQRAMDLVEDVYRVTRGFPKEELYALTNQLRRAVVSIASNIAEGEGRANDNEFVHFLRIAHGSLREVETQLLISARLQYLSAASLEPITDRMNEIGRLINGLIKSLRGE